MNGVRLCEWCGFVDDEQGERCPCPPDALTVRKRWHDVQARHQAAVALARGRAQRAS